MNYYDRLQQIKEMATWLQGSPIPEGACEQANLHALKAIEECLRSMVLVCCNAYDFGIWCGVADDPCRERQPLARWFD